MAKVKLTAGRIADFQCDEGKAQVFLWCAEVPGLGVRATADSKRKRYIFQAKVKGQSMRVTIGDVSAWSINAAQAEARRLQILIDQGNDPRQVKADKEAATLQLKELHESVTVDMVWLEYIEARKANWSAHHLVKHERAMQKAGQPQKRGKALTVAGELESLAEVRLVDLTPERVTEWARA